MKNLNRDSEPAGEQMTLFSQAGSLSHANPTHSQENDSEKKMTAISGRKCLELSERSGRLTLWAKMFSALLIGQTDWYSTRCRLIWRLKATKYNRLYFQLVPQTHRTGATDFGLLPTVLTKNNENRQSKGYGPNLAMALGLLPTPRTSDKNSPRIHGNGGQDLRTVIAMRAGMLPTPMASDSPEKNTGTMNQDSIAKIAKELAGTTSRLNPRFTLEMMGFPPDWTELPFRSGETNQSNQPETP